MHIIRILSVALFTLPGISLFAQVHTSVFKVSGNCTMCKERIEKAAIAVPGVDSFEWNVKTKEALLRSSGQEDILQAVQQKIAASGHDTEKYKASAVAYHDLPACCRYERHHTTKN